MLNSARLTLILLGPFFFFFCLIAFQCIKLVNKMLKSDNLRHYDHPNFYLVIAVESFSSRSS